MAKDAKATARALPWDAFQFTNDGIKVATKTIQGVGFAFTADGNIIIMCDDQGLYTTSELTGCLKQNGNYSDYDTARTIATVFTTDLDLLDIEDIKNDIQTVTSRVEFTPKAAETLNTLDWVGVYTELEPYIKAIQELHKTKTITM